MRRSATMETLLPLLYLKGISTKDFGVALEPILGKAAKNVSPNVISKLKDVWSDEYLKWQKRDLSEKKYVYTWADGVYLQARMENEKNCVLVLMGADSEGKKELIAIVDGFRESKESWRNLLLDLKDRGLSYSPKIAVGDGALGFWGALKEVFPEVVQQRCWVHKTSNILDKLPKSQQENAKKMIHDIYMAENRQDADKAFKAFVERYNAKYPKAVECLDKDKEELLAFYDFPGEHWVHLRTTNPIESTFATVRHRTRQSRNCFSKKTIMSCVFKLFMESQKRWRSLRCKKRIAEVINLQKFIDGVNENEIKKQQNEELKNAA